MIKFQKYRFRKYNKNYPRLFSIEKKKLSKILSKEATIEHVGSTAVPGLGGKGIIDIAISVKKSQIPSCMDALQNMGFQYKPKPLDNQRKYLERSVVYKGKERRVHIHLTYKNSPIWKNFIIFRDYLRHNEQAIKAYSKIKKQALKKAKGNGKTYLLYKQKFIKKYSK